MTEDAAKAAGISCVTGKALALANARSVIQSPERGFLKIVCDATSGKVIGAQMMCYRASELVSELSLAIASGMTASDLASSVRAHPTLSELITAAAKAALR
jgi:dihydrolipoamide dehydrogenase